MGIDLPSVRLVIESLRIRFCQRIFLGTFEAAIAPSLMLSSSRWYTKSDQAPRFSIWFAGLGLGQIIGGMGRGDCDCGVCGGGGGPVRCRRGFGGEGEGGVVEACGGKSDSDPEWFRSRA